MKINVMIFNPTINQVGLDMLSKEFNLITCPSSNEETIIKYVNEYNIQVIVTRVENMTAKIFDNCPNLKIVAQHGVGVNHIDLESATRNGVLVLNVPDSNHVSVAEHTLMFILALSRDLLISDKQTRKGNWDFRYQYMPIELSSKKLLILGFGMIGRELANKARAFHMELLGFDPFVSKEVMDSYGVKKMETLEEGLKQADFVSIHVPLTPSTKHLLSMKEFEMMKETAYIINVARGPIVNEKDLYQALKEGKIAGAGLDVMEEEPPQKDHPLFELDNVIFTPHLAGDTQEAKDRCAIFIAEDVTRALKGNYPKNIVNLKVLRNCRLF